jgi:formate-dependent nitrite reductase membrane component NrfD
MTRIVADPHWYWYIVIYFFLGGIAAGVAFAGALAALFGGRRLRPVVRLAAFIPLPLALLCTVLLVVDLGRPERFLHMVLQSETWLPMFKYWSPMSYGSWILSVFSALAAVNFIAALWGDRQGILGWLPRLLGSGPLGMLFQMLMLIASYGLASYTGALLGATNQLFWSDSSFIGMLFFISAVGTGISTLVLIALLRPHSDIAHSSIEDLETADNWAMGLELVALAVFFVSLGGLALPLLASTYGITILVVTGIVGLILPLLLHFRPVIGRSSPLVAACLAIVGGFALRWAIVFAAQGVVVAGR